MEVSRKTIITMSDVGNYIKAAREKCGLTIEFVSLKSGFTTQTISNLEKNRGSVNLNTLLAVATVVNVKLELNFEDRQNVKIKGMLTQ
jgi:transcriptional regulator with XRE-family HTH domain